MNSREVKHVYRTVLKSEQKPAKENGSLYVCSVPLGTHKRKNPQKNTGGNVLCWLFPTHNGACV